MKIYIMTDLEGVAGVLNFQRKYREINGLEFSRVVFREALDLFANLFMSTGKTARGVLPFHTIGYKIIAGKFDALNKSPEEEVCMTSN